MKIAVPITTESLIDDHFGHCAYYGIYTVSDDRRIEEISVLESEQGCGCKSNIATTLASLGVTVMLAGGIGGGAINVLNNAGIEVIRGCTGQAEEIVRQYIGGSVTDSGSSCRQHENHHGSNPSGGHECNH